MTRIYKYTLELVDGWQEIEMPAGARIVSVATQTVRSVQFWAIVSPNTTKVKRRFSVVGTGHDCPPMSMYVGTAFDLPFVWHVFEAV